MIMAMKIIITKGNKKMETKKEHACVVCKYFYKTKYNKSKTIYNPLIDCYQTLSVDQMRPTCGHTAPGSLIDDEAVHCSDYVEAVQCQTNYD